MKCHNAIYLMHMYFDGDIDEYSHRELFNHLKTCEQCKLHFNDLKKTDQLLKQFPHIKTSPDFVRRVIAMLPIRKKEFNVVNLFKKSPLIVAASIFILLFSISMISYIPSSDLKVVSGDYEKLIVQGNEIIVPEGTKVSGDIIIENGNIQIKGEVAGDVTVINGKILMASASRVDGRTNQVDQIFEWIIYNIKKIWIEIRGS